MASDYFYTVGCIYHNASKIRLSHSQHLPVDAILKRSCGEWTPNICGPIDTISKYGYFSKNRPHSKPAWIANTFGSAANKSWYAFLVTSNNGDCGLGAQPG